MRMADHQHLRAGGDLAYLETSRRRVVADNGDVGVPGAERRDSRVPPSGDEM